MTFIIGLTGGAACGKSTTSGFFKELGVPIVDADAISHSLTEQGGVALPQIQATFGKAFIHNDALDRARMRELVFRDTAARLKLEAILQPMIQEEILREISRIKAPYGILDAALLIENDQWRSCVHRLLVVDVLEELQLRRLMEMRHLTISIAQGILRAQTTREKRLSLADDVIINSGTLQELREQVRALHHKYLTLGHEFSHETH